MHWCERKYLLWASHLLKGWVIHIWTEMNSTRAIHILVVEDNAGDIFLIKEGFHGAGAVFNVHVVKDGLSAIEFVERSNPRPDLVILDLNIPGLSGHQVLNKLKSNPEHMEIPVVVFSSSNSVHDIRTSYKLRANTYVKKPSDLDEFFAAIAAIESFWTHTAALPLN
jgi:two-component system, chemotaxis family, response regulator Rcp1